ncbi:Integrase catalytic region [Sulfobacillus acidophilus TPY]|uniref:Integrase catalytic region n=1 Tax=Sulfobacillus acidophilus (strain ATCC 700253 / DSM 10332 / NAL) TaxID=679936 RepID=G8U1P7_SULAD|nr:Integrase catalytic region [Sulfobacillus acidophilus TPY]AEW06975.1 integrase catalytic region [Sulfobacillus acidophilus DSM 10332]
MKNMKEIERMVTMFSEGYAIAAIAETLHVDRKTVRKYVYQEDFSEPFPQRTGRKSPLDPFKPTIQAWLAEDARVRYKQRHTAERVYQRLQDEYGDRFTCSYSTVQRYIKQLRAERPAQSTGTLELEWHPGTAQVDFGTADIYWQPGDTLVHAVKYLVVSFPFSNAALWQYFPGETAECVVHGLQAIWQRIGGVPSRVIFDNATGIGRRIGEVIRYAELFERFKVHYGFDATFCNPDAGHEKGNVEANIGYLRRHVMVPPPILQSWDGANDAALAQAPTLWTRPHYKKGLPIAELFETDRKALRALPTNPFHPVRYLRVQTDGYGKFRLDAHHWYSSGPEWARQELVVAIGAFTVVPYTPDGTPITRHDRQYGETRTDTIDPRTTLHRLSRSPGAFRNSPLRGNLPEPLVTTLDTYARQDLKGCLQALADVTERYGFDLAIQALENAVQHHQIAYPDILVRAARMAEWP